MDDDAEAAPEAGVVLTDAGPMVSYTKADMTLEARDMVLDICDHYPPDTGRLLRLLLWLYLKGEGVRAPGRPQSPARDRKPALCRPYYDAVRPEYRQLAKKVGRKNANREADEKALAAMPAELKVSPAQAQREARFAQTKARRK